MKEQWIAYLVFDGRGDAIATGSTGEEAFVLAVERCLQSNVMHGCLNMRRFSTDDLSPADFAEMTRLLDEFFAKQLVAVSRAPNLETCEVQGHA